MKREQKKKRPGDAQRARERHLRRQRIQDAISAVRRGETCEVELYAVDGVRCAWRLSPVDPAARDREPYMGRFLVYCGRNRLEVCDVVNKDGVRAQTHRGSVYVHRGDALIASAEPINDAARAWAGLAPAVAPPLRVLTLDEYRAEDVDAEQYVVEYDEPDADGFYGRRLDVILYVVGDAERSAHGAVRARFAELHPRAVDVRVSYA